jgi:hypothetical protein
MLSDSALNGQKVIQRNMTQQNRVNKFLKEHF